MRLGWVALAACAIFGCDSGGSEGGTDSALTDGALEAGSGDAAVADCAAVVCQNGGTCTPAADGPRCDCRAGFTGDRCEVPSSCEPGVELAYAGDGLPADLAGHYAEASDCEPAEGGSTFGGHFTRCFRKSDGSPWRIWNTGCGWEVGRHEPAGGATTAWAFYARTYAGRCDAVPAEQLAPAILATAPLLDAEGAPIDGLSSAYCPTEVPMCRPGVQVLGDAAGLPRELAGFYAESFSCTQGEGGAWFGGDFWHCFRKNDGSGLRIWNTGCGWTIGRREPIGDGRTQWVVLARTYTGQCDAIPPDQLDTRALTTSTFFDDLNTPIEDISATYCPGERPLCRPGVALTEVGDVVPDDLPGHYAEAFDCTRDEGGAFFGGDFSHCFRKEDGSPWRIWNSGCGWEIGRREPLPEGMMTQWVRHLRTYDGQCDALPPDQLDTRALTTSVFYDEMNVVLMGLTAEFCAEPEN